MKSALPAMACAWLSAALMTLPTPALAAPATFATLKQGQAVRGFRAAAVYLGDTDRPMGARFIHRKTGFTLDVLEIQSVPQGFIWVTTFPTSDMGEPHTQEHLLLGKGNKGRAVATLEPMALAHSSAFTMQWRTCYSFYTPAGADVFFSQTERRLDALLHPDYTDEAPNALMAWYKTWYNRQPGVDGSIHHYKRILGEMGTPEAARALKETMLLQLVFMGVLFTMAWSGFAIEAALLAGYEIEQPQTDFPVFAFKLHQFISRGDTVYATLEPGTVRHITT